MLFECSALDLQWCCSLGNLVWLVVSVRADGWAGLGCGMGFAFVFFRLVDCEVYGFWFDLWFVVRVLRAIFPGCFVMTFA